MKELKDLRDKYEIRVKICEETIEVFKKKEDWNSVNNLLIVKDEAKRFIFDINLILNKK